MSKDPDDLPPQAGQGHPLPRVPRFQRFLNLLQHLATQVGQGHHLRCRCRCRCRCRGWARTGRRRLLSRTGRLGGRPPRRRPTRSLPFALVLAALLQRRRPSPPLLPRPPRLPAPRRAHLLPRTGPRLRMKPTPALRAPSTRSMRGPAHPFRFHAIAAPAVEAPPAPPPRHRRTHLLAIGRWRPEGPGGSARRRQVGPLLTAPSPPTPTGCSSPRASGARADQGANSPRPTSDRTAPLEVSRAELRSAVCTARISRKVNLTLCRRSKKIRRAMGREGPPLKSHGLAVTTNRQGVKAGTRVAHVAS